MLRVFHSWLNEVPERDILNKYGVCCEVPCLMAVYSIDDADPLQGEGNFIRYECICGKWLYTSVKSAVTSGEWI